MDVEGEKRGPGRPRKVEASRERRERRVREGADIVGGKRLGVLASVLDRENFAYRWFNDDEVRMFSKVGQGDWAVVLRDGTDLDQDSTDYGQAIFRVVGKNPDGSARRAYLCRVPKEWYLADKRADQEKLDEVNRMINRGYVLGGNGEVTAPDAMGGNGAKFYVPRDSHIQGVR